jgi:hypothetical protein
MTSVPGVIGLLYRADWTRLSLLAEVTMVVDHDLYRWREREMRSRGAGEPPAAFEETSSGVESSSTTLLVAPGRRYREQSGDDADGYLAGSDGTRSWQRLMQAGPAGKSPLVQLSGDPEPPFPQLLSPRQVLSRFTLEVGDQLTACGRDAIHVIAMPRRPLHDLLDQADLIVDAELGILLRYQELYQGQVLISTELADLRLDPPEATDTARFTPPAGSTVDGSDQDALHEVFGGPGWAAAKGAAGLAAGGLGALIKYCSPDPAPQAEPDPERNMPPSSPDIDETPLSDEILYLVYRGAAAAPEFTATLHDWNDVEAMLSRVPEGARRAGFGGLGFLIDAASNQIATLHLVARCHFGGQDRYRIDYPVRAGKKMPTTVACDGQRHWQVYVDKVTAGAAAPPPRNIAELLDASWLLGGRVSGGTELMIGERRAFRLSITGDSSVGLVFLPAEAVVDAELGVLLRLTSYAGDRPVMRREFRDIIVGSGGPGDFHVDIPPGIRTIEETGNPLQDAIATMPGATGFAIRTAADAAKRTSEAVTAARSFLDSLRGKDTR